MLMRPAVSEFYDRTWVCSGSSFKDALAGRKVTGSNFGVDPGEEQFKTGGNNREIIYEQYIRTTD